mmetsp:Transcript_72905/g.188031  ORF Transcript_72905/g.188031 Transcript_72905/m.188031 type:complete len:82 (+) Transcript_72905:605-850(+)
MLRISLTGEPAKALDQKSSFCFAAAFPPGAGLMRCGGLGEGPPFDFDDFEDEGLAAACCARGVRSRESIDLTSCFCCSGDL